MPNMLKDRMAMAERSLGDLREWKKKYDL
jgi:hypothetical protein